MKRTVAFYAIGISFVLPWAAAQTGSEVSGLPQPESRWRPARPRRCLH